MARVRLQRFTVTLPPETRTGAEPGAVEVPPIEFEIGGFFGWIIRRVLKGHVKQIADVLYAVLRYVLGSRVSRGVMAVIEAAMAEGAVQVEKALE